MRLQLEIRTVKHTDFDIYRMIERQFHAARTMHVNLWFVLAIVIERISERSHEGLQKFLSILRAFTIRGKRRPLPEVSRTRAL